MTALDFNAPAMGATYVIDNVLYSALFQLKLDIVNGYIMMPVWIKYKEQLPII